MTTLHEAMTHQSYAVKSPGEAVATHGLAESQKGRIGEIERVVSAAVGGALIVTAARRFRFSSLVIGALGGGLLYRAAAGHCPLYQAIGTGAQRGSARPEDYFRSGIHVVVSALIHRPADELYRFWRDLENLPRFMNHLDSVTVFNHEESHWRAKAPAGMRVQWDARIINEEENRMIAWRSLEGADVDNAGSVWFIPQPDGSTEVRTTIEYIPPAGQLGEWVARLFGEEPAAQIEEDLNRLKDLMEQHPVRF